MPLAHVTLATRDVRQAETFFAQALGWRMLALPNNVGRPAAWLEIAPGQQLHLVEVPGFEPSPFESEFGRHVAIAWPRDEFDALKRRLKDCGAVLIEPQRPTPFVRFFFRSPDGYIFEVLPTQRGPDA